MQIPGDSFTFSGFRSADVELSRVYSFEKRQELLNILHSECPDHYSRLWLAGFLKHVGYSLDEVCSIIEAGCVWSDYDARMTWCQVRSLFRGAEGAISSQVPLRGFRGEVPLAGGFRGRGRRDRRDHPCTREWIACRDCPDKCSFVFSDVRQK